VDDALGNASLPEPEASTAEDVPAVDGSDAAVDAEVGS
jgi:hypothetical protein